MKVWKSIPILLGVSVLILSCMSVSAIDDRQNDVVHFKWDEIYDWHYEVAVESKPSVDIDDLSLDIIGDQAVFTMTLYGNVMTDHLYHYMATYNSDEIVYTLIYGAGEDGTEQSFGSWSTSDPIAYGEASITAVGNVITATYDTNIEGSTNVDYWGIATLYTIADDTLKEHWVDYAPDDKLPGTIIDPDSGNGEIGGNGDNDGNGDGAPPPQTPGFELLTIIASLVVALILFKRRK